MAKSWGNTTGGSNGDKMDFMKFGAGKNVVRIVSGVLPRYVYWLQNKDGNTAPFECLRFDRDKERFVRGKADPVHDMGFMEKDVDPKTKLPVPLRPKKNYVAIVINRSTGKLEVMEVKATILQGIQSIMGQLNLEDPSDIDITIEKKGTGFDTKYDVQQIAAMQFQMAKQNAGSKESQQHEADAALIGEAITDEAGNLIKFEKIPNLDELYPVQSYEDQKKAIDSFMEGKKEGGEPNGTEGNSGANAGGEPKGIDREAASDLD